MRNKVRNYSFRNSKRLPESKMTEVNGVKVPSMPGSCYHAIICALAQNKNKLVTWPKVFELTERYMRQYGGISSWEKFKNKCDVKTWKQRIKDNTHTLTRNGRDCYGYRLHERGCAIYFFRDGAILLTGGQVVEIGDDYNVEFPDGRGLQHRYRGTTMTSREYKKFLEEGFIDQNGRIKDIDAIRKYRAKGSVDSESGESDELQVCVTVSENASQDTALRLEKIGFVVEDVMNNELIGRLPRSSLELLKGDEDVIEVETEESE